MLHCILHTYIIDTFTVGVAYNLWKSKFSDTIGMLANTILYPFYGNDNEIAKDSHCSWVNIILPVVNFLRDMLE